MAKSYKGIRLKKHRVYSVQQLQDTYGVHANTVTNWIKAGLAPSDRAKPFLFRGADVNEFHQDRRARTRIQLRPGEFKCTGCKMAVLPVSSSIGMHTPKSRAPLLTGLCSECGAQIRKLASQADLATLDLSPSHNTTEHLPDEDKQQIPGRIVSSGQNGDEERYAENDRLIHNWQIYAGRYDEKTIDRHIAAIRFFEGVLNGKRFDHVTIEDIALVRDKLKASLGKCDGEGKSKSTVQHILSHLADFLRWLVEQKGYRHLPKGLADYLKLPKSAYASALPRKTKEYPSLIEAEALLAGMPSGSLFSKRNRAIFAIAFLGALRADTIISLRRCHLDVENKRIIQDASRVRTKNGKSLEIVWFPIQVAFEAAVVEWAEAFDAAGFRGMDALFPAAWHLQCFRQPTALGDSHIEPMNSRYAVTEAFSIACRGRNIKYTPHSAKHSIAAERDERHLTSMQRKAWSQNMGHDSEQITELHYGKLSAERRIELIEEISDDQSADLSEFSDEVKIALFDGICSKILRPK